MSNKPHSFTGKSPRKKRSTAGAFTYCVKCGLVILKNEATVRAMVESCPDNVDV